MGDAVSRTVKIGDQDLTLQEFSGFKAFEVMRRAKDIMKAGPQIQDAVTAYIVKYEADNVVAIDRAAALHRYGDELKHLTDEDWRASGNQLKMPRSPGPMEIVMQAFPVAFDIAHDQTLALLGVVALDNRELEDADAGGQEQVDKAIADKAKQLVHRAKAQQLVLLAAAAVDLMQDQFDESVREAARPLLKVLDFLGIPTSTPAAPTEENPAEQGGTEEPATSSSAPESAPKPTSSTSSPPSTDGPQTSPSTEPAGVGSPS